MKSLINKVVRITSDNENYKEYLDKELVIVDCYHVEGGERGYSLVNRTDSRVFPYSLYEWEFELV